MTYRHPGINIEPSSGLIEPYQVINLKITSRKEILAEKTVISVIKFNSNNSEKFVIVELDSYPSDELVLINQFSSISLTNSNSNSSDSCYLSKHKENLVTNTSNNMNRFNETKQERKIPREQREIFKRDSRKRGAPFLRFLRKLIPCTGRVQEEDFHELVTVKSSQGKFLNKK